MPLFFIAINCLIIGVKPNAFEPLTWRYGDIMPASNFWYIETLGFDFDMVKYENQVLGA
jgi:hypothetical protein